NPIYLSYSIIHIGIALAFANVWMLFSIIPVVATLRVYAIAREEKYLEEKFGEEYRTYKKHVRRWL
ncbi:MAG: isoprenylcysteine carboxylmethyltransferase family protein, partial [Patescibacteria group bacterium]